MDLVKEVIKGWKEDDCSRLAASFSYYAILSIPAIFILVLNMSKFLLSDESAIIAWLSFFGDNQAALSLRNILLNIRDTETGGLFNVIIFFVVSFAASNMFIQLRKSLNHIFGVKNHKTIIKNIAERSVFVLFLVILVLLNSLLAILYAIFLHLIDSISISLNIVNFFSNLLLYTVTIAIIYKFVPENSLDNVKILKVSFFLSLFYVVGNFFFTIYLRRTELTSFFGAAGSVIILLLWIYYSAQLLFLGAQVIKNI